LPLSLLSAWLQDRGLLSFERGPETMHIVENISSNLLKHFRGMPALRGALRHGETLLAEHANIHVLKPLNPAYRWRLIWGSSPVTWRVAFADWPLHLQMIDCLTMWTSIAMSSPPERTPLAWLRLTCAAFIFARTADAIGLPWHLSEHLLYPHSVDFFWRAHLRHVATERHEYLWKPVREAFATVDRHNTNALATIMRRLLAQLHVRRVMVRRRERIREGAFTKWWHGVEVQRHRIDPAVVGAEAVHAFTTMLQQRGFAAEEWWHAEGAVVVVHDGSGDTHRIGPAMPSVRESANAVRLRNEDAFTELDRRVAASR
jgi:hypothetical protein